MIEILKEVLKGNRLHARILADWIEEYKSGHREFARYHKMLLNPDTLRLQTLLDVIIKFGPKKQRSLASQILRKVMRSSTRRPSKGCLRALLKKKWSFSNKHVVEPFLGAIE